MRLSPVVLLALISQLYAGVTWAQPGSQPAPPATAGSAAPAPTQAPTQPPSADPNPPTPAASTPNAAPAEPAAAPSEPAAVSGEAAKAEATPAPATEPVPASTASPDLSVPSPGELSDRLVGDLPPAPEQKTGWTAPTPIVTLHGYLRVRGELMDRFWLNRPILSPTDIARGQGPDPFSNFRPLEHRYNQTACADEETAQETFGGSVNTVCKVKTLQFASMRFRFSPQLNISEDIRIKSTFDILDNYVLGTGPQSYYGAGQVAQNVFPGTNIPVGQVILPRRVWAEVRNRDLGELRFGLMPDHWGLGMLYNAGNGLDDDYSTDLGRVMGTTKLLGFYLSASYDFLNEGRLYGGVNQPAYDASQLDDLDQFTFSVVRRVPDEDEETVLARGDMVLNGGARFQFRHQDSLIDQTVDPMTGTLTGAPMFKTLNATMYTPDVWAQLKYGKLRLELEAAWVAGHMVNTNNGLRQHISQIGAAFEGELRLLNDKLGVYFYSGFASGDSETEGLSNDANYIDHAGAGGGTSADSALNNSLVSTFRFSPAYRVDLILWRTLMRQIAGAYYFKPGLSYDFVRDNFGQLFGARVDAIWSRAAAPVQTWGNDPNLGLELNAQVYWRSADGPNQNDGYHASLQYGVLFPMKGLGMVNQHVNLLTAQTVRLVLGVMF
jgi:uncharacterized protein (TIGR04551 family)